MDTFCNPLWVGSPPDMAELEAIANKLREELNAAVDRLKAFNGTVSAERAIALREVERANIRFADFVLRGVIPPDLG
jgi:hypothetical protein